MHEFEALLLVAPDRIAARFPGSPLAKRLRASLPRVASPEEIDEGPETHPSARIQTLEPMYRKPVFGPPVAEEIGLPRLRQHYPHFDQWVSRLEQVGLAR